MMARLIIPFATGIAALAGLVVTAICYVHRHSKHEINMN